MDKKQKRGFKMPHVVFLLIGLMVIMCLLTYVIPTGQFVKDENGINQYVSVDRSPVNPLQVFGLILQGTINSGSVISLLLLIGGSTAMITETKAIDRTIDYLLYRLQDKGTKILVPCVFALMTFIAAFAAEGALAIFPVAVVMVKKLKLDPISATSLTTFAYMVGFGTSPVTCHAAQALMDVPIYSGFGVRFLNLVLCTAIGAVLVTHYALRVQKDPSRSIMNGTNWMEDLNTGVVALEEKSISIRDVIIVALFFLQYVLSVYLNLNMGMGLMALPAVMIPTGIICGILARMDMDRIGNAFLKGVQGMSTICIIIGMAGTISLIMKNGMILDTIAYYISKPLAQLNTGLTTIGIAVIVGVLNIFIPSASAKAAALIPIIKPIALSLGLAPQLTVQAYQIGDGLMNGVSPINGVTVSTTQMCKVDFRRWLKWYLPRCLILYLVEFTFLYLLTVLGWH